MEFLADVLTKEALTVRVGPAVQIQLRDKRGTFPPFKALFKAKFWSDGTWSAVRAQVGAPRKDSQPLTQGDAVDMITFDVTGIPRNVPFYKDWEVMEKEQQLAEAVLVLCNHHTFYHKDGLANLLHSPEGKDTTAVYIGRIIEVNMHMDALTKDGLLKNHKAIVIPLHVEPGSSKQY